MPPVFSAVITNYNYERYLADAVQSVLCQTFAVREIVVVDDGSTDGSRDLLEAMERTHPQLKLVRQANGGQLAAFQSGARAATGDYIALLDADDEWLPAHIEGVAGLLGRHPELDFIFTNMHYGEAREGLVFADRLADLDYGVSRIYGAFAASYQYAPTSANVLRRDLLLALTQKIPAEMLAAWRTRADDCIGYGADILGARKYYLAQPSVRYRIHASNHYARQRPDQAARRAYRERREAMFAYYRAQAGLGEGDRAGAVEEFARKPMRNWRMLRGYLRLVWKDAGSVWGSKCLRSLRLLTMLLLPRRRA